ncbi:Gx transporter family protein [Eggerthella sp. NSJ-70]|uniref:Gx transporter family protein n=1 Tax=Eggerthella hominis TaxID=2763043 RepID=A0ABR7BW92_9ACTN|nr:Gx transporter family protein [Eggerthella hominis]MBC5585877.1 Gx transporter family protein [Eggerthella hominis]
MASTPWRVSAGRASAAPPTSLRVCRCALLAALALALTALESLIPIPLPVPGMKLGVANIVTVAAAFWLGPIDAAVVLGVRIVLAAFLTGQLATLPFSLVGGACALAVTLLFVRFSSTERVRLCAMVAATAHNIGQIAVAVAVTGTPEIAFYLPVLLVTGVVAGFLTGTVATAVLDRLPHPRAAAARARRVRA